MNLRKPLQQTLLSPRRTTSTYSLLRKTTASSSSCLRQLQAGRRSFSNTSMTQARNSFVPQQPKMKQPSQKAMSVIMEESRKNIKDMPSDFGLIPGTVVMPTGSNLPSLQKDFAKRWKLEKARLVNKARDFITLMALKYYSIKPRPDLQTAQIPTIAKSLYQEMYTALATGKLHPLEHKTTETLLENLYKRTFNRAPNTTLTWTLHKYLSAPKIVSHKMTPLPVDMNDDKTKQNMLQQAIVRIASTQTLERRRRVKTKSGKVETVVEEGSEVEPKDVVEYFVVQRIMKRGEMGDWMIWGTTRETDIEDIGRS